MINSMTGYGEAQGEVNGVSYLVEIKTVNHRYFKAIIRLPEPVAFIEEDIDKLLRNNMSRGTINYVLRLKNSSVNALFDIDETALKSIMEKLNRAGSSAGIKGAIDIGNLLSLPGIIQPALPDKKASEQIREKVLEVSQKAIDKVKQMRAAEGGFLEADLKKHCTAIEEDLGQICARGDIVLQEYAAVAIFADRSDISEEVARLNSHLQQFVQACQANELAGRRLDFISQEMLREANTIASKASNTNIIRCVVDIKCRVDRIKEQVQNVE
ncbi:MAG: YicC family protein [Planctomycetota bacterium]|jgi:uncharacterized protein YicC (UPF0701 family)